MHRGRMMLVASLAMIAAMGGCVTAKKAATPPPAPAASAAGHINGAGLALIKASEGLELTPYNNGNGWYVGYGHAISGPGGAISEAQAEQYLRSDLAVCEDKVAASVTAPMTANEFSAMVSLCYNLGWQNFAASSVVRNFNAGDKRGAADAFLLYTKATIDGVKQEVPHLRTRRDKERALFLQAA